MGFVPKGTGNSLIELPIGIVIAINPRDGKLDIVVTATDGLLRLVPRRDVRKGAHHYLVHTIQNVESYQHS